MKPAVTFIAGILIGLLLPFLCGRQIAVTVTHKFDLPLKRISP